MVALWKVAVEGDFACEHSTLERGVDDDANVIFQAERDDVGFDTAPEQAVGGLDAVDGMQSMRPS